MAEIRALDWYALEALDRSNWRFAYQFDLFREVAREAMHQARQD